MTALLNLSRLIDRLNEFVGRWTSWLVLAAVLISAVNASARKAFSLTSNAFLEVQWYLFAGVFLLAAGYTLLRQEHVKIDVVLGRFRRRTQVKVEIFGFLVFLLPFVVTTVVLVWPLVTKAFATGEMSSNAGGLIRWPVLGLIPLGFTILLLQACSELIKRFAFLQGALPEPFSVEPGKSDEELLAEELAAEAERKALEGAK